MKAENRLFVSSRLLADNSLTLRSAALALPLLLALAACGGGAASTPPPETPTVSPAAANQTAPAEKAATSEEPESKKAKAPSESLAAATTPTPATIEFPPHATVDQAIRAIPQGQPRTNMADDALRAPLLDLKRYDKCKVPHSTKVTMTVAVYDGAAVGLDISSKPKSAKIEECVDGVVRGMTWSKVPSLNTVSVSF